MRRGNLRLVVPASYLTPLFSVWISSLYLGISLQPQQWLAGVLVVTGAIICKRAVAVSQVVCHNYGAGVETHRGVGFQPAKMTGWKPIPRGRHPNSSL